MFGLNINFKMIAGIFLLIIALIIGIVQNEF